MVHRMYGAFLQAGTEQVGDLGGDIQAPDEALGDAFQFKNGGGVHEATSAGLSGLASNG
jgi:hypothetical protein